jgi:hypothetical protein
MPKRPPDNDDDFVHIKNERLRFWLCVIHEGRLAFEAAAASKWITYWTCSTVLGRSALWAIKTYG